ncbi:hypothetical protein P280DRAFT_498092 [Massarina eburnea CBS 473.64]|uniref:tRNA (guanine(9)-N1)-methyltransferase n=1 Tax=Massarina eburnea CBS 473.64 TaxID=1395130 RepID=A0A6A6S3F7_9PLEO|nr:hypothetical protein P280DRAFT_498092 [Massarina eburnea CBS 473.64]
MESEERPAKMRKLEHANEIEEQSPADIHPGEEIIGPFPIEVKEENEAPKLSKNQLKKKRRLENWEAGREDRKVKRKEKIQEKKERRREEYAEKRAAGEEVVYVPRPSRKTDGLGSQVPITVIFDCDFDDLMFDNELKSLGLQLTRCYSDNRKAPYRMHVGISSFGGKLKERYDGILAKQYTNWKGVHFCEEDFVAVSEMAKEWMKGEKGGTIAGALQQSSEDATEGEVIYLSAESDVTLERLEANSTYIIGGLVDKNRHKGICHKRAMERGIKTAKLPIGEFLQMKSRQVLTTNHVMEIMLRWLEFDDWGKAFMAVLPKRKGGVLKGEAEDAEDAENTEATAEATAEAIEEQAEA